MWVQLSLCQMWSLCEIVGEREGETGKTRERGRKDAVISAKSNSYYWNFHLWNSFPYRKSFCLIGCFCFLLTCNFDYDEQWLKLNEVLNSCGFHLIPHTTNIVDDVWTQGRPASSRAQLYVHDIKFSGKKLQLQLFLYNFFLTHKTLFELKNATKHIKK